ncbi:HDOD domain-containing protein [Clostridium sp. FP2]|uniref:response regulator n=1 Tax=Clostridium sp. FP2 TaxID=2724481 RepID=UPI0013E8FE1A|nr:response regulator [Clostridium sp. FP2]MBZ9622515.1 HDOD domain-containing protein [Clostridium sp. FP2]
MDKSILFVDDEKPILKAIRRMFLGSDYTVFYAESGAEALDILSKNIIVLIVSDLKMPEMDGYELLSKVMLLYPSTIRVILSGYAEENLIFRAIKNNLARAYFLKPWEDEKFKIAIDEMFKTHELLKNENLLDIVNSFDTLPTLPGLYMNLNKLIARDADIEEISSTIQEDPAISSKILQVANCAYFGAKTGAVKKAIMNLGLVNIKNIILTSEIFNLIPTNLKEKESLWAHSSLTNQIMVKIYKNLLKKKLLDKDASAGLMHDIGKIILFKNFPIEYENVLNDITKRKIPFSQAEKERLGVSHEEIGAYLLNWWGIPDSIVESALYHHNPLNASKINLELTCTIHIADYYSLKLLNLENYSILDDNAFSCLNIEKSEFEEFIEHIKNEVDMNGV